MPGSPRFTIAAVTGLLEREDELEALSEAVRTAASGRGRVVLVGGEAGIGKSSLVEALRERLGGSVTFLVGGCEPLSVPVPLAPWRELVEAADGGDLLDVGSDDRLVLTRRVASALEARGPVVAVVEDVHWADPLTLDLLRLLARRAPQMRAAIVVTFRDDEVAGNAPLQLLLGDLARAPTVRITLRPLSGDAVRLLAATSGLDVAELERVTGGNPFLVTEVVAAADRLPASVRDAALARAGRLTLAARVVVDAAAVIGQRFDVALLEAVVPGSGESVEEALARGVLVADETRLGFRHELIREAIANSISPPRLAALHARVFAALAGRGGTPDVARLAHHAERAGLEVEACRYAALASLEAERMGALRESRLQAERALRLGGELSPGERFEVLLRYSRAANFSSTRYEEAVSGAEEALAIAERLEDRPGQARALGALAWALWSFDRMPEARDAARRAIAVLEPTSETAAVAVAESTRIRIEATAFDPEVAIAAAPHAIELATAAGLDVVRLDVEISVALAHGHRGAREALSMVSAALEAAKEAGLVVQSVRSYVNFMCLAATLRDHQLVDAIADEALDFCDEHDTPIPARVIEGWLARSLADRGRWSEASTLIARSVETWHSEIPVLRALDGLLAARRGGQDGQRLLARAWEEVPKAAEDSRHGMIRCALIEAAWLRGDSAGALEQLEAARCSPAFARYARPGGELALWAWRLGCDLQPPAGVPLAVQLELQGDWRGAVRAWREAHSPYDAALAALPGDDRAAREALAALQRLSARAAAEAFARERATRGARAVRGPRRSTVAHPAGLTRREQEVLEELATGASNPAIAGRLHLSERTVAHHVSTILAKLGVTNRLAAVERARSRGLLAQDGPVREPT